MQTLSIHQRLEARQRLAQIQARALHVLARLQDVAALLLHRYAVLLRHIGDLRITFARNRHRNHVGRVLLRNLDGLRLRRAANGLAGGLQPRHQLRIQVRAVERRLGVGTVLQLRLVRAHRLLRVSDGSRTHRLREVHRRRTHVQRLRQLAIALDDATLLVALQLALGKVLDDAGIAVDADETLLHLAATAAGTMHHHVEHAGHVRTRLSGVTRRLARVLAELTLLPARLAAAVDRLLLRDAGAVVTRALAAVAARQQLAAHTVAEDLLAVAGNSLHDAVAASAHALGQRGAGGTGTEVALVVGNDVSARTALHAGTMTHRRSSATDHRRLDHLLPAGTRDRRHHQLLAGHAGTGVTGQVTLVLAAVEQLAAGLVADVEGAVGLLSLVRTAELHALVTAAVQVRLAGTRADEGLASLPNLLLAEVCRTRSTRHSRQPAPPCGRHPARHLSLREGAATLLRHHRRAGRTGTRVTRQRTRVAARQRLPTHFAAGRVRLRTRLPVGIQLLREVLSAGTATQLRVTSPPLAHIRHLIRTRAAVQRVTSPLAAMAAARQQAAADTTAAVASHARLAHRHHLEGLGLRHRLVVLAQVAQSAQVADHVIVVHRRIRSAVRLHRVHARISRAHRDLRLPARQHLPLGSTVAAAVHRLRAGGTVARVTHERTRVFLAVEQLPAHVLALHGAGIGSAAHHLSTVKRLLLAHSVRPQRHFMGMTALQGWHGPG